MNGEEKNESFQKSNLYPELNEKSNVQLKSNEDMFIVIKAADFAARRHRFQMRRDGRTPYINHPVGVAYLLTRFEKMFSRDFWRETLREIFGKS